jgi:hypothetical protein
VASPEGELGIVNQEDENVLCWQPLIRAPGSRTALHSTYPLIDSMLRRVSFACVHDVFHFLAFLVANLERTTLGRLEFDF